ncbi:hypothetical protein QSV34_01135 [Porticoccus sp. W117]|uniref:DUF6763 family protein n=1 Tax=Porticoccus sp. W117 TaxID=3054777 RepID=UPI0025982919|nr:DUF6763 family protein [Porticoccus sp. W117]MDM3869949.1 hypothetical protein [Porticoccus sp. W117]
MAKHYPEIGSWYQDAEEDVLFEVVAVDDSAGTIEIQLLGGEVSELDFETWGQMLILGAEAPEDWRASYELSSEDSHELDDIAIPESPQDPLSTLDVNNGFRLDD